VQFHMVNEKSPGSAPGNKRRHDGATRQNLPSEGPAERFH
jgi:hypothetical protein